MEDLVQCVPNFSEGRDSAKVDAIVAAITSVQGVTLLDREMDADHNRSVITFVAPREAVIEARRYCHNPVELRSGRTDRLPRQSRSAPANAIGGCSASCVSPPARAETEYRMPTWPRSPWSWERRGSPLTAGSVGFRPCAGSTHSTLLPDAASSAGRDRSGIAIRWRVSAAVRARRGPRRWSR